MSKIFPDNDPFEEFGSSVKDYLDMRKEVTKLTIVEHLSQISAKVISFFLIIISVSLSISFFSTALSRWLNTLFHSELAGPLIMGGFFLIIFIIIFSLRKKLFTNNMVKMFIKIFFDSKNYGK